MTEEKWTNAVVDADQEMVVDAQQATDEHPHSYRYCETIQIRVSFRSNRKRIKNKKLNPKTYTKRPMSSDSADFRAEGGVLWDEEPCDAP
jgi:hypothetical protein